MLLLTACGGQELDVLNNSPVEGVLYFLPPTLVENSAPIQLDTPTPPPASPTPICENGLVYVEDVTVPDGTEYEPGAKIEKIWKVENTGSCNWEAGFNIQFVSGNLMDAKDTQALFPARSGSEVEIQIFFTAPLTAGRYNSSWQAFGPNGEPFGQAIYMDIIVNPDLAATETPTLEPEDEDSATPETTPTETPEE